MPLPYLGEIRMISFPFAPRGWALCKGQLLPINQNQALFALLGTTYGGNGTTTFALPTLDGQAPIHRGQRPSGSMFTLGQMGGETGHNLTVDEMPAHRHAFSVSASAAGSTVPTGRVPARTATPAYSANNDARLRGDSMTVSGSSVGHDNVPPFLRINFIIALQGVFPSQS